MRIYKISKKEEKTGETGDNKTCIVSCFDGFAVYWRLKYK